MEVNIMYNGMTEYEVYKLMEGLDAEEQKELHAELSAMKVRQSEARMYTFEAMSNEEKLQVLKKWYPKAYLAIKNFFPGFAENPREYHGTVNGVNAIIYPICGAHRHDFIFT